MCYTIIRKGENKMENEKQLQYIKENLDSVSTSVLLGIIHLIDMNKDEDDTFVNWLKNNQHGE